mgnify:CR=1 FL=1
MENISLLNLKMVKEKEIKYDFQEKQVTSPSKVVKIATDVLEINEKPEESFYILTTDTKLKITGIFEVSRGGVNTTIVHPREVFKRALLNNAYGIFLLHNHPSGDPSPSNEDMKTTDRLAEAGKIIGIKVLDHIIIGDDRYVSFKEKRLI